LKKDLKRIKRWKRRGLENMHRKFPDKPILVTEFGCLCNRGIHGNILGSEEMQAAFFQWHYPVLKSKDYVEERSFICQKLLL